jgi:hypothetical protein
MDGRCYIKHDYGLADRGVPTPVPVTTPWPLVRKRTIPTERPPLVGEIEPL